MFKFYVHGKSCRLPYQSQEACCSQAKLASALYRMRTDVVDMSTGEVLVSYDCGLLEYEVLS